MARHQNGEGSQEDGHWHGEGRVSRPRVSEHALGSTPGCPPVAQQPPSRGRQPSIPPGRQPSIPSPSQRGGVGGEDHLPLRARHDGRHAPLGDQRIERRYLRLDDLAQPRELLVDAPRQLLEDLA